MSIRTPLFSINSYDFEGGIMESGLFLHFGDTRIQVSDAGDNVIDAIDALINSLERSKEEIRENYNI